MLACPAVPGWPGATFRGNSIAVSNVDGFRQWHATGRKDSQPLYPFIFLLDFLARTRVPIIESIDFLH
jgi:hypothetical protein